MPHFRNTAKLFHYSEQRPRGVIEPAEIRISDFECARATLIPLTKQEVAFIKKELVVVVTDTQDVEPVGSLYKSSLYLLTAVLSVVHTSPSFSKYLLEVSTQPSLLCPSSFVRSNFISTKYNAVLVKCYSLMISHTSMQLSEVVLST